MRNLQLLIFISCFLFSCGDGGKVSEPPADQEKFAEMLVDLHLLESSAAQMNILKSVPPDSLPYSWKFVLEKHRMTEAEFKKNMNFYLDSPEKMEDLYGEVLKILMQMEGDAGDPE